MENTEARNLRVAYRMFRDTIHANSYKDMLFYQMLASIWFKWSNYTPDRISGHQKKLKVLLKKRNFYWTNEMNT